MTTFQLTASAQSTMSCVCMHDGIGYELSTRCDSFQFETTRTQH